MAGPKNDWTTGVSDMSVDEPERSGPALAVDVVDWGACLETPPERPSGNLKVRMHFRGRDKPLPADKSCSVPFGTAPS